MPVICIGPVCIPISAILPVLLFIFRPIYNRLPKSYQESIDKNVNALQKKMNQCLRKIGWLKSKKNKNNNNKTSNNSNIIKELSNEDEWESLMNESKTENVTFIAYFTAPYVYIFLHLFMSKQLYVYTMHIL